MKNLKKLAAILLIAVLSLSVLAGCASDGNEGTEKQVVKIGYINWADNVVMTELAKLVLEEKMGYEVETINAEPGVIFTSLADGSADFFLDLWLPITHEDYYNKYEEDLVKMSKSYDAARIGLVVPEYVDIDSIEELEENKKNKVSTFRGEEKYRIMMEGIPCWPYIGYKMKTLAKYGVNMTGSVYPHAWALQYEVNDLDGMARAYSGMFNNVNLDQMTEFRVNSLRDGKCDGAFYHMNRSCKLMSLIQYEMQRKTEEITGIPSAGFDGDQADPRGFTKAQFETRIQGLVEVMDERKNLNRGEI